MRISALPSVSSSASSTTTDFDHAVKIVLDDCQASHLDEAANCCYVNPKDCAVQSAPGSTRYIFDIEFLQRLRRQIRKSGRFELARTPADSELRHVAHALLTLLERP